MKDFLTIMRQTPAPTQPQKKDLKYYLFTGQDNVLERGSNSRY